MLQQQQLMTNLTRVIPGRVSCEKLGCTTPLGATGEGFTSKGLILHTSLKHKKDPDAPRPGEAKTVTKQPIAKAVFAPMDTQAVLDAVFPHPRTVDATTSAMEDVKHVVDTNWEYNEYVTPQYMPDGSVRGWFVRGRNGDCCSWVRQGNAHGGNAKCKGYFVLNDSEFTQEIYGTSSHAVVAPQLYSAQNTESVPGEPNLRMQLREILGWQNGTRETWEARAKQLTEIIEAVQSFHASVEISTNKGVPGTVSIQARAKKLYVSLGNGWEEMSLEQFVNNVRFAIHIS